MRANLSPKENLLRVLHRNDPGVRACTPDEWPDSGHGPAGT